MNSAEYFIILMAIVIFGFILDRTLTFLNLKSWSDTIPSILKGYYDETKYKKARAYQLANAKFGITSSSVTFLLTLIVLYFGTLGWLDDKVKAMSDEPFQQAGIYFFILVLIMDVLSLPFSLYGTFVIEEKFGFNKTTPITFLLDKIKSYVLMIIIGGPILYLLILFYNEMQEQFWLYAWLLVTAFMLAMTTFYASFILPVFNKLTPLEDGDLKQGIEAYCAKVGYDLKRVYVMNGSKRSSKANAFFSGLGRHKTIVLFDTLVNNHTKDELIAVLAHEVGHYKKKHTLYGLILGIGQMGVMFYLLSLFLNDLELAKSLGAGSASFHLGLIGFAMIYTPFSTMLGVGMNMLSRKNEFEADAFARETYDGPALVSALKKLSSSNLGNPNPHPLYVFINYSHPPVLERIKALEL